MLLSETRITDKDVCIDLFRESLTQPLQTRILMLPQAPATLDQWYEWAAKLDHQWKRMRRILGKTQDNTKAKGGQPTKRFFFPRKERDPNAMDVDALSIEDRTKLMKEGKCFRCRKTGHMAVDCPDKGKNKEETKKLTGADLYTHIRGLFQELDDEGKKEFYGKAEETGF